MVSCLCITKNGIAQLGRAIECFFSQTYKNKELVIVCNGQTLHIEEWFRGRRTDRIKLVQVVDPSISLGELRNIAMANASGEYFCQWDDDDWFHCDRVKVQMEHILKYKQPACVLNYLLIFDVQKKQAFLSKRRLWEGSLLCKLNVFPKLRFQPWPRHEDANFIYQLLRSKKIVPVLVPALYIYVCHGANTSDEVYFGNLFNESQKLSVKISKVVDRILRGKINNKAASLLLHQPSVFKEMDFLHGYLESLKQNK